MPKFCEYRMCHNLGSSTFGGYCNREHQIRGEKDEQKDEQKEREDIRAATAAAKKDEGHKTQSSKTDR